MGTLPVGSGNQLGLRDSSFVGDSRSSLSGGVRKLVLGLGPVQEMCLGCGGWGEALRPNWGRLGEALPPGKVALRLWRLGKTANNSAHQRASSRLAALMKVTRSGDVRAKECGWPVTCSAPVTSSTLHMSTEPWGTVSGCKKIYVLKSLAVHERKRNLNAEEFSVTLGIRVIDF